MAEIQDGRYSSGLYKKGFAPSYVLMPPVHTQHKESMFCQTKGVPICPIHLDAPYVRTSPYVWMPSICLAAPLYVWMLPNVWWHPKV